MIDRGGDNDVDDGVGCDHCLEKINGGGHTLKGHSSDPGFVFTAL